jgi:diamine N-acetyltransferase
MLCEPGTEEAVFGGVTVSSGVTVALRPTTSSDLASVLEIEADPEVSPWITCWPAERHLEAIISPDEAHLTVVRADRTVGFVLLAGLGDPARVIELRRIALSSRGAGIGYAALAQTLRVAFTEHDAQRVWLDVLPGNLRARHVYQSSGFRFERLLPGAHPSPDGPLPLLVMSIQRPDWETSSTA